MSRILFGFRLATAILVAALTGSIGSAPAAPVPQHLMPKGPPPFDHPTTVGTKWVYQGNHNITTLLITKAEEKEGTTVITIESVDGTGKQVPHHKLSVSGKEWCWVEEIGAAYEPPWRVFKRPLDTEQKWEFDTSRNDLRFRITGSAIQAAKTEQVKVPAGTFTAVKVESTYTLGAGGGKSVESTCWYTSGVGLVQMDDPPTFALKSFTPGKN